MSRFRDLAVQHVSLRPSSPPDLLSRGSLALLANAGGLAAQVTQVVELGPAHIATGDDFDLLNSRRVHGEGALNTNAESDLAHGKGLTHTRTLTGQNHALEDLNTSAFPLRNLHVHLYGVTGTEFGNVIPEGSCVDRIELVHDYSSFCHRSETRSEACSPTHKY